MDLKLLDKEFESHLVKKLRGFEYVEPQVVQGRLDDALGKLNWQFEILKEEQTPSSLLIFGRLGVRDENNEWVWKSQVGGKTITYYSEKEHTLENINDLDKQWKSAVSDCIKKCATLWGVARHLYGEVEHYTDPEEVYEHVMAAVQKGEELLAPLLNIDIGIFRKNSLKHEELSEAALEELGQYYKALQKSYKESKKPSQAQGGDKTATGEEESEDTEPPPRSSTGTKSAILALEREIMKRGYTGTQLKLRSELRGKKETLDFGSADELGEYHKLLKDYKAGRDGE